MSTNEPISPAPSHRCACEQQRVTFNGSTPICETCGGTFDRPTRRRIMKVIAKALKHASRAQKRMQP